MEAREAGAYRDRGIARAVALAGALALAALASRALLPPPAWADAVQYPNVIDMFNMGPLDFISCFFCALSVDAVQNFLAPCCQVMFSWSTDFMDIPIVNNIILAVQAVAASLVIAVRITVGIREGIFADGGPRDVSLGEYVFKTIIAVIVVAAMPMICRTVIEFGNTLYNSLTADMGNALSNASQENGDGMKGVLSWFSFGDDFTWGNFRDGEVDWSAGMWAMVGLIAIMVLTFACGYQFVRRQVEMVTISIIGPLVSVYSATDSDSTQVWDLLKNLFGLTCVQWLQYLLVLIAIGYGQAWFTKIAFGVSVFSEGTQYFMACIAFFGAALTVPAIVDRYTYGGQGSRVGGQVVSTVVGMAIRDSAQGIKAVPRAAGRGVVSGARAIKNSF